MPTIDEYFGNYLKTEDVKQETEYTIKECRPEDIGKEDVKETKLIVFFEDQEKGLVLNKVNSEAIAEITNTREFDKWQGTKLCLYVDPNVMFGGKRVGGIRVKKVPAI